MAFLKVLLFVVVSLLGYTSSSFVDTIKTFKRCELKDEKCQVEFFKNVINVLAESGAPEYNIPKVDPMHVKNVNGSIYNVIDFIFVEGIVKGVKNCEVTGFHVDMEKLYVHLELKCDITVKGTYLMRSTTDLLKSLIGGDVHGEGSGKVKLDGLSFKIGFPFEIIKRGDDFFFSSDLKKYKYSFKVHKRVTFYADKLYVGEKESSKEIVKLVNENWKLIVESFGGHVMDVAVQYMYPFILGFFRNCPAKYYITDDLSKYVK